MRVLFWNHQTSFFTFLFSTIITRCSFLSWFFYKSILFCGEKKTLLKKTGKVSHQTCVKKEIKSDDEIYEKIEICDENMLDISRQIWYRRTSQSINWMGMWNVEFWNLNQIISTMVFEFFFRFYFFLKKIVNYLFLISSEKNKKIAYHQDTQIFSEWTHLTR